MLDPPDRTDVMYGYKLAVLAFSFPDVFSVGCIAAFHRDAQARVHMGSGFILGSRELDPATHSGQGQPRVVSLQGMSGPLDR